MSQTPWYLHADESIARTQQAITWSNIEPNIPRPMASIGHNDLNQTRRSPLLHLSLFQNTAVD